MNINTHQPEFPEIPLELQRRFDQGRVVLFIGAGASVAAGLPDWEGLAERVAQEKGNLDIHLLRQLPLETRFSLFLDGPDSRDVVREVFRRELDQHCDITPHRILIRLPVSIILTTNYDPNIERAAQLLRPEYGVVRVDRDIPQQFKTKELTIVHLYGDTEDFLASEDELATFESRRPALSSILQNIFLVDTVFFLGFSLRDSNVLRQILITRDMLQDETIRHYACMVTENSQLPGIWHNRGVNISIVKPGNTSRETSQIFIRFLEYLARAVTNLAYDLLDREDMVCRVEAKYYSECMNRKEEPLIRQESTFSVLALPESFEESGLGTLQGYELGIQRKKIYMQCMKKGTLKILLSCRPRYWENIRGYNSPMALQRLQEIRDVVKEQLENPRFILGIRRHPLARPHQSSASLGNSILLSSDLPHSEGLAYKISRIVRESHAIALFNDHFDRSMEDLMRDAGAQFGETPGPDDIRQLKIFSLQTLDRLIEQLERA